MTITHAHARSCFFLSHTHTHTRVLFPSSSLRLRRLSPTWPRLERAPRAAARAGRSLARSLARSLRGAGSSSVEARVDASARRGSEEVRNDTVGCRIRRVSGRFTQKKEGTVVRARETPLRETAVRDMPRARRRGVRIWSLRLEEATVARAHAASLDPRRRSGPRKSSVSRRTDLVASPLRRDGRAPRSTPPTQRAEGDDGDEDDASSSSSTRSLRGSRSSFPETRPRRSVRRSSGASVASEEALERPPPRRARPTTAAARSRRGTRTRQERAVPVCVAEGSGYRKSPLLSSPPTEL